MPRRPAQVTQVDIARAISAMRAAGYPDVRVVFRKGSIIVEAAPEAASNTSRPKTQELVIIL